MGGGERCHTILQLLISVTFLLLGYYCSITQRTYAGIDKIFSYYILFFCGYYFRRYHISDKKRKEFSHFVILLTCMISLVILNNFGNIELVSNTYTNPVYFLTVSLMGWQFLYEIAHYIQKNRIAKRVFIYIGKNTLAVVILHFLCFKIVNYLEVILYHQPTFLVAAFPTLYTNGFWWIVYLLVGLIIPICLSTIWKSFKRKISVVMSERSN